jgi:hypothetical protein
MSAEVLLLKHGKPVKYLRCAVCDHYARGLSERGWCGACEQELAKVRADGAKRKPPCP